MVGSSSACSWHRARAASALAERADALLDAVEEAAASLGAPEVYLHTGTAQPEAIRLCERHGYVPIPLYGKYVGATQNPLCYAKDIRHLPR